MDTEDASELAALKDQLKALKAARASGVLIVRHGDESLQYRSMAEIVSAINAVKSDIRALTGEVRKPAYGIQYTKGL